MPETHLAAAAIAPAPRDGDGHTVREGAFFDVDNTLMRGASLFHAARKVFQLRLFTFRDVISFAWKQLRFIMRGENMKDIHAIRDVAQRLIGGLSAETAKRMAEEIFDEMIESKIWPGTRALAENHIADGRQVWLVTATPVELASVIAGRLGLTGALGTVPEVKDGHYTGNLVGTILHGPEKAVAVRKLAADAGLNLEESWAYSDSINDLPLLTLVGHPVAINPDRKLRRHARENNWPIYDFRSGRRAATLGLRAATGAGVIYGLYRGLSRGRR